MVRMSSVAFSYGFQEFIDQRDNYGVPEGGNQFVTYSGGYPIIQARKAIGHGPVFDFAAWLVAFDPVNSAVRSDSSK